MKPLLEDRPLLQRRAMLALKVMKQHSEVDPKKLASIGYCFGGLVSLDLARCGVNINGAVSLH